MNIPLQAATIDPSTTPKAIIERFLGCYQRHHSPGMHALLDPEVSFSDLAFKRITGADVRAMWQWYCVKTEAREPVDVLSFQVENGAGNRVHAKYEVDYTLKGGHHVRYIIQSKFELRDGKIVTQADTPTISDFQFARMATGFPKYLLALTPLFRPIVRLDMKCKLKKFRADSGSASPPTRADCGEN